MKGNGAIPKLDVERPVEHQKEIVRVVVLVPMKWPFELGDHDVVVVVGRYRARRETVGETRKLVGKIGGSFHDVYLSSSG